MSTSRQGITVRASGLDWRARYAARLSVTDMLVLIWVVFGAQIAWLGFEDAATTAGGERVDLTISYTAISLVIIVSWMLALSIFGTRGDRVVGAGSQEYKLIADATVRVFGLVAIVAFVLKLDLARGYVLVSFPVGLLVLLFSRWMWRQWLNVQRQKGEYASTVVLAGSPDSVATIARELNRFPQAGYKVIGACLPEDGANAVVEATGTSILGSFDGILDTMHSTGADTLVITSSDQLSPRRVREISWGLEPAHQNLVVAPSLVDIGGPRIHTRPVAGLPLIHVEMPRYEGRKLFTKRAFDLLGSTVLITLLSPLLLVVAVLVRSGSAGPALFRQERIGIKGQPFGMLKFRSMVVDAEDRLDSLSDGPRDAGNEVMFKLKDDPRVTPIGRWIRRYSIDELPQLFNVWMGQMSLVGPRPPLPREVASYATHVHRRFLVRPGMTGLWQISGRSQLSWEDTVRLDLFYVENWSLTGDFVILWRTAKAVFAKDGAF